MPIRKKLITPKIPNQKAALVRFAKRHRPFVKKLVKKQLDQKYYYSARFRQNGDFLFFAHGAGMMTPNQVEAVRRILLRQLHRLLRIWMVVRFTGMVTNKPKEVRMGKGKGTFSFWCRDVYIGSPIFEVSFVKKYSVDFLSYIFQRFRAKFSVRLGFCGRAR